jgi:hypothetical protein
VQFVSKKPSQADVISSRVASLPIKTHSKLSAFRSPLMISKNNTLQQQKSLAFGVRLE